MYSPTIHLRLASLAATLPAGSPAHRSLMAHLKIATPEYNLFTRLCIMLGAAGHPFREVARAKREGARGLVSHIQSLRTELPDLDPEWFDNRNANKPDFYNAMYGSAMKIARSALEPKRKKLSREQFEFEVMTMAQNLLSNATAGTSDTHGNLAYQLGKSRRAEGLTTLASSANALANNISMRGLDEIKAEGRRQKRDVSFDPTSTLDDEDGKSLADTLTQSEEMGLLDLILNTTEGRGVLRIIEKELNFVGKPKQQAAWDAIKENPALISSNERLADAMAERTGERNTPQAAGAAKQLVLRQVRDIAEDSIEVERELSMLAEMSRLRRASAKKKRLAALLRTADTIKHAYDKGMLDNALKLLKDADTALHDLANILDARVNGVGSVADTFNTAADLSKWLRGNMSKEFATHNKAFRAQVRGKK